MGFRGHGAGHGDMGFEGTWFYWIVFPERRHGDKGFRGHGGTWVHGHT